MKFDYIACAGNFALRARCKWRGELRAPRSLQVARGTSRSALVASRAGNFALRARCKWRGELPSMHGMDAVSYLSTTAAYFCIAKIR